jgi:hypothetical protein
MNHAVEMGLGATTYIPSVIKIDSGIQKLMGGLHIQTHKQKDDFISLLLFFSK